MIKQPEVLAKERQQVRRISKWLREKPTEPTRRVYRPEAVDGFVILLAVLGTACGVVMGFVMGVQDGGSGPILYPVIAIVIVALLCVIIVMFHNAIRWAQYHLYGWKIYQKRLEAWELVGLEHFGAYAKTDPYIDIYLQIGIGESYVRRYHAR